MPEPRDRACSKCGYPMRDHTLEDPPHCVIAPRGKPLSAKTTRASDAGVCEVCGFGWSEGSHFTCHGGPR
jgi:ribosomal protein L37E